MPPHQSATSIKTFCDCEAQAGYYRYFINAPRPPFSVALVYGKAIHKAVEVMGRKIWIMNRKGQEVDKSTKTWTTYWTLFVQGVLYGKHGSDSQSADPEPMRFFSKKRIQGLSPAEVREMVEEERRKLLGKARIALEAFRLEAIQPHGFSRMRFELEFSRRKIILELEDWFRGVLPTVRVNGVIDLMAMRPDGNYIVKDYKTGWITDKYRQRQVQIEDPQMTIYHYALNRIYGNGPMMMFIQPLELSKQMLQDHGPLALRQVRIPIPPRNDSHFQDLALLASDIHEVSHMVVHPELYTSSQRMSWVPNSTYGRKAEFQRNVQEGRLVPRIGKRCESCDFIDICREDHAVDWARYERDRLRDYSETDNPVTEAEYTVEVVRPESVEKRGQLMLLEQGIRARSKYVRKPLKELKKEMVKSGDFVYKRALRGSLPNKVIQILDLQGPCPCRQMGLVPLVVANAIPLMSKGGGAALVKELSRECPYPECPRKHRKQPEDAELEY